MKTQPYKAVRSRSRAYGYTVQDVTGQTRYFTGPGCTGGWYRFKRDAQHQADVLSAAREDVRTASMDELQAAGAIFDRVAAGLCQNCGEAPSVCACHFIGEHLRKHYHLDGTRIL